MPQKTKVFTVHGSDAGSILAIAYGTLEKLEWKIKYAGENVLIAYTPASWNYKGNEITIGTKDNELNVTSKMVHGESFDLLGKYKKHINTFYDTFEAIKTSAGETQFSEWKNKIIPLREETELAAEQEMKLAEEVNSVMNLSSGNTYITYGIITINVLVFIAMVVSGVSFIDPTGEDVVNWGGNFLPYTSSGEWWRLLTCVFVHIGIIHLLFNMYALYTISVYLEPMLGKFKYIVAYLCTGIFASLASLWWHEPPVASAGASGAIFGMYGIFLALLSTNLIPKQIRSELLKSIGIFVVYNLVFGMKSGVDNAAHIGGLVSGLIIGYIYFLQLRNKDEGRGKGYQPALIVGATILASFLYLNNTKPGIIKDDREEFSKTMEHFAVLEELALAAMQPADTASKENYLNELKNTALTDWVHCVNLFESAEKLHLPSRLHIFRNDMLQYSGHRVQQTILFIKAAEEDKGRYQLSIDSIQRQIDIVIEKINKTDLSSIDQPAEEL